MRFRYQGLERNVLYPDKVILAISFWYCCWVPFHTWMRVSGFSYTEGSREAGVMVTEPFKRWVLP